MAKKINVCGFRVGTRAPKEAKSWSGVASFDIWRVLVALKERPHRTSELVRRGSRRMTLLTCVFPRLHRLGAITEELYVPSFPAQGGKHHIFSLTKRGVKLAEAFEKINEVIVAAADDFREAEKR